MRSFRLAALALIATAALAQPALTPDQIKSAILYGQSFDTPDKYMKKALRGRAATVDFVAFGMSEPARWNPKPDDPRRCNGIPDGSESDCDNPPADLAYTKDAESYASSIYTRAAFGCALFSARG